MNPTPTITEERRAYFKEVEEVLNGWKDGATRQGLAALASNIEYVIWAPQVYQAATDYFNSDEFKALLPRVESLPTEVKAGIFAGHNDRIFHSIVHELRGDGSGLRIIINEQGKPEYKGDNKVTSLRDFLVSYGVRHQELDRHLEKNELTSLAEAITYALPLAPKAFADVKVEKNNQGCYLWLDPEWMKSLK